MYKTLIPFALLAIFAGCKSAPKNSHVESAQDEPKVKSYGCQRFDQYSGKTTPNVSARVSFPTPDTVTVRSNAGDSFDWVADKDEIITLQKVEKHGVSGWMSKHVWGEVPVYEKVTKYENSSTTWTWHFEGGPAKNGGGFQILMYTSNWRDGEPDDGMAGAIPIAFNCG